MKKLIFGCNLKNFTYTYQDGEEEKETAESSQEETEE